MVNNFRLSRFMMRASIASLAIVLLFGIAALGLMPDDPHRLLLAVQTPATDDSTSVAARTSSTRDDSAEDDRSSSRIQPASADSPHDASRTASRTVSTNSAASPTAQRSESPSGQSKQPAPSRVTAQSSIQASPVQATRLSRPLAPPAPRNPRQTVTSEAATNVARTVPVDLASRSADGPDALPRSTAAYPELTSQSSPRSEAGSPVRPSLPTLTGQVSPEFGLESTRRQLNAPSAANPEANPGQEVVEARLQELQDKLAQLTEQLDRRDTAQPAQPDRTERLEQLLYGMQSRFDQLAQAQTLQTLQQQQLEQLLEMKRQLESLKESPRLTAPIAAPIQEPVAPTAPAPAEADAATESVEKSAEPTVRQPVIRYDKQPGDERYTLTIQDAEIGEVLEMLAGLSGQNIVKGRDVAGRVSATLHDVSVDEALAAIVRSHGYAFERDDRIVYVSTPADLQTRQQLARRLVTKVFRPKYISAADLESILTPFITPEVGKIATTLTNESGLTTDGTSAGGDRLVQQDAVLVQDYEEVVEQIERVILEMDQPPMQVVIEAMILNVQLTDQMQFGVNFALLNDTANSLALNGNGRILNNSVGFPPQGSGGTASIIPPAGQFIANTAGLKYGLVRGDITMFVEALERLSDTNMIAAPQLRVINKQKAELIIGNRLGYTTVTNNGTTSIESANFLDVGTKLVLRPFITDDGMVRMEIHPERSSGAINDSTGLPDTQTTEVTTNIMVRDGATVVIGGLIEEQIVEQKDRIPLLGALPLVGPAFQNKSERTDRTELIVLITPRIVRDAEEEVLGRDIAEQSNERREHFRRELAPVNRANLAQMHLDRAQYYYDCREFARAHVHAREAARLSNNSLPAIRLRKSIEAQLPLQRRQWWQWWRRADSDQPFVEPIYDPSLPEPVTGSFDSAGDATWTNVTPESVRVPPAPLPSDESESPLVLPGPTPVRPSPPSLQAVPR